jgi:hypothetical protein
MSSHRIVGALVLAASLVWISSGRAADCSPRGNVAFICGLSGPEDMVQVPQTSWVVTSSVQGGPMRLVNTVTYEVTAAFPSDTSQQRFDSTTYSSCPGPFDPHAGRSITHGIALRPGQKGIHTLYVVHHGFRETVEIIEIDARGQQPVFTWIGCVPGPKGISLNAVAPLPDRGIAGTYHRYGVAQIPEALAGGDAALGEVYEWHPGESWKVAPGSAGPGPNGLEVSPDGRWIYVALWPAKKIMRISRGQAHVERTIVDVSFHPDNLRWQTDGSLLTGGHYTMTDEDVAPCQNKPCDGAASRVARIDPRTMKVDELISYPSNELFFSATAALQIGKEIWISSFRGDRIVRYPIH